MDRRSFLRMTGVSGVAVLGSAAGVTMLSRRAFGLPSGSQNIGFATHQRDTMEAIADTALPGPYWPDTAARASAWGVSQELQDAQGGAGAVQAGAWFSFFDDAYGLNPYFDDLVSDIDSCSNGCWPCDCPSFGKDFKKGTRAQRLAVLDRQVVKGGQFGILKDGYLGAVNLAKYCFFGGLVSDVGLTYTQFPMPAKSYAAADCPKAIPDGSAGGALSSLVVAEDETIDRLQVLTRIDHPYIGDLVVTLLGPGGFSKVLHSRGAGSADNIHRAYEVPEAVGRQSAGTWSLKVQDLATYDAGVLQGWSLMGNWRKPWSFAPSGGAAADRLVVNCTAGATSIPDNGTPVDSPISLVSGRTITGLEVGVDIDHPYVGDLKVELVGPNGVAAILQDRVGGSADNIYKTYAPTTWNGAVAGGTWRLRVTDLAAADAGVIQGTWSLRFRF